MRKAHKWTGLILALLILAFSLSGIILNHRDLFSSTDISRNMLPHEYRYQNWNMAAVKASQAISPDSILVYGNIGVWLTDTSYTHFSDFNRGFPEGMDNRKIAKILKTDSQLLAATLYGLYSYNHTLKSWQKVALPVHETNVVDLIQQSDSLLVLTRSHLLLSTRFPDFRVVPLPEPQQYDNRIGLFKTLWVIHSGEIMGFAGKLLIDLMGLLFIFLSIGGIILFFSKKGIRTYAQQVKRATRYKRIFRWNFKWHAKIGWIAGFFLLVLTLTGMFLRPPLLIAIAESKVPKIPGTELSTSNAWFDALRRIIYIPETKRFALTTSEGFYSFDNRFSQQAIRFSSQPPASVMGVTVLQHAGENTLLIGSFEGLFEWNYNTGAIFDVMKHQPYVAPKRKGPPVGDYKISGYISRSPHQHYVFEYEKGALPLQHNKPFTAMPQNVLTHTPLSLWNLALEVHTGRIYHALLGNFYILVIPLGGMAILFSLVSGLVVEYRRRKKH